ncbi:MAG: hypothetical protein MPN21_26375 [Thermoanaerobaculia bacterium]|nr:hypothetical protein [Thermoanaerobaculia bacterium]
METPNVTGDGRLIVINGGLGGILYSYNDPAATTGLCGGGTEPCEPCDPRGWTSFAPISGMHGDTTLTPPNSDTYGLAEYPIRDTQGGKVGVPGQAYVAGDVVRGTYPWLDRSGNLLVFSQVGAVNPGPEAGGWSIEPQLTAAELAALDEALFVGSQATEVSGGTIENAMARSAQAGLSFFGLWSRGKMIHLDGRANLSSYVLNLKQLNSALSRACPSSNSTQLCMDAHAAMDVLEDTGFAFRNIYSEAGVLKDVVLNEARNTQLFSMENHFNYVPSFSTIDARDVTWQLQTARNVMELAFDDFVSPQVLINSSMVPSIEAPGTIVGSEITPFFRDGFTVALDEPWDNEIRQRYVDGTETPRIQNAASAEGYVFGTSPGQGVGIAPPPYGELHGDARVEPIAAGGLKGRGVFLDGAGDHIQYSIAIDGVPEDQPWLISFWVNGMSLISGGQDVNRDLLHFPDGTILMAKGISQLRIKKKTTAPFPQTQIKVLPMPTGLKIMPSYWRHVAIQVVPNQTDASWIGERTKILFYVDGFLQHEDTLVSWNNADWPEVFQLTDGDLIIGDHPNQPASAKGFRGWIDEFKIIRGQANFEEVCRHAYGTLMKVGPNDSDEIQNRANAYPEDSHDDIADLLGLPGTQYVCDIHYPETDAVSGDLPGDGAETDKHCILDLDRRNNPRCIGHELLFPEGPLFWNAQRPDSTANAFCLSCHTSEETRETMDPDIVLVAVPGTEAWEDDRRQPTQPPQRIFGMIPSHFTGHMYDDETEIWTDCFILSAESSPPADCPL